MTAWKYLAVRPAVLACLIWGGAVASDGDTLNTTQALPGFDRSELSETVSPAEDFFTYVNGPWLDATAIPPEWSSYGVMQMLYERSEVQVRAIAEEAVNQKISDLYASFMDQDRVEALALRPLAGELKRIDAIDTHADLMRYLGHAISIGVQVPVNFYIDTDAADPETSLVYFWQDGLGLPDRDYYLADNPALQSVRDQYRQHVVRMFEAAGWPDAVAAADVVLGIEAQIAEQHWTRVQNRDRQRIYSNKFTLADANQLSPGFEWSVLLSTGGFGTPSVFVIAQDDYFARLGTLLQEIPVADWRTWLRFKLLKAYAPYLHTAVVQEDFDFERRVLRGQEALRPRWKRGVRLINGALGELVGQAYVERHFPPDHKARVEALVENLRAAFAASIDQLDWMSAETRQAARQKLALFRSKIGYPDHWRDYSGLTVKRDDLAGNVKRSREFEHAHEVGKLRRPVDREEWGMTPQTVNAYYRATLNEIVFPAAILQPPFFDPSADDAVNYGAIGSVIGHEFSHGFDDQGRKFDGQGRLHDWWTSADASEYERRAQGLVDQYNQFRPLPDMNINGELTLGENIADLAGVIIAQRAYELSLNGEPAPVIDGITGLQRFYIGYALGWRSQYREELLREVLVSDPHAPPRYRVTGVLRNLPEFHQAFRVEPGDPMYLPPAEQVRIW